MRLEPLFEMVYRYNDRQAIELDGPRGSEGLYWMFREGTLVGPRIRGGHKGMNKSTLRVDGMATGDIRGVIQTDDGACIYYEVSAYGLASPDLRHVVATMTFQTGDQRYAWLNPVKAVLEGRYTWGDDELLTGTSNVFACVPEFQAITPRRSLHSGVRASVTAVAPTPATEDGGG